MIIGISGQSGSGKDTVADFLTTKRDFTKIGLADPLKRICREIYDFSYDQLWGPSDMRNKPDLRYPNEGGYLSPRVALQTLGTEWGREMYTNTWIDYGIRMAMGVLKDGATYTPERGLFSNFITKLLPTSKGVVFSDIRFKNEMNQIRLASGFVIRIKRPGKDGGVGVKGHASEEEQKSIPDGEFDAVINNTGTLDELFAEVDQIIGAFRKAR